jgi:hypothetical protein
MATSPGFLSAYADASQTQNLFTVDTDQLGKTRYTSAGTVVNIEFPSAGASSGSDIVDNQDGTFTLAANLEYSITATATVNNVNTTSAAPALIAVRDLTTDTTIGNPVTMGQTVTTTFAPGVASANISVLAAAPGADTGATWAYPAQVTNAAVTIQVIGGY